MADIGGVAADQLRSIVERIERLEEDKKAIAEDIKEVVAEARSNGYDVKALRTILKIRKMDKADRQEQEYMVDLYLHALGMLDEGSSSSENDIPPEGDDY
ncbi:MAG: DUF2312 domain-containing protein [Sneathiella sp.]|nr:DUF2312 domain-containing protein [Sneathiella sp.]